MQPEDMRPEYDESAHSPALARRRDRAHGAGATRRPVADDDMDTQPSLLIGIERTPDLAPDIPPLPPGVPPLTAERDQSAALPALARSNLWPIMIAVGAIVIVAGVGLWFYGSWTGNDQPGEAPLILAEEGPEKVRPADEGGMEVPNQELLIYDQIGGEVRPAEPETLLPEPETPLALPVPSENELPAEESATASTAEETLAVPAIESAETSAVEEDVDIPMIEAPSLAAEPATGADQGEAAIEPSEAVRTQSPTQTAAAAGAYRVQLAAVKSEAAAKAAWIKLSKLHGDQLGGMSLRVEQVDRGADGVLYRVQAGPLADRATAQSVCAQLKKKDQPCIVVAP